MDGASEPSVQVPCSFVSPLRLALRALLALGLLALFYVLAASVAAVLLMIPIAEYWYLHHVTIRMALFCLAGAGTVLRASFFIPRPQFSQPGPEIREDEQPELFALIRDVAARMEARMPAHVYVVPDVNAFVSELGGVLGVGSRRIMGIGLGLMHAVDVSGLKGVVAHELGHYVGGHTRLSGLFYAARGGVANVIESLRGGVLSAPFRIYGHFYLRVTRALGRTQELEADRASIEVAGRQAHIDALRRLARGHLLFGAFVRSELAPVVAKGLCPRELYAGFETFADRAVMEKVDAAIDEETPHPYDTHPVLADRIAFANTVPDPGVPRDERPAVAMVRGPDDLELRIEPYLLDGLGPRSLERVAWNDLASRFYGPRWAEEARMSAERIHPVLGARPPYANVARRVAEAFPTRRSELALALRPELVACPMERRRQLEIDAVGHALAALAAAAFVEAGAVWSTAVGAPLVLKLGGQEHDPMALGRAAAESIEGLKAYREAVEGLASPPNLEA
jgi:heat shock protein HtpX